MVRNFVAEVKERDVGEPCFLYLNLSEDIGMAGKSLCLNLPEGTGLTEAKVLRDALHASGAKLSFE